MWKPGSTSSDDWVTATASLPIAFSQVREDPLIDQQIVEQLGRPARVLIIASGGETAALLASLPIDSLHVVDANPAQLCLCKLKLSMIADTTTDQRLRLLGHTPMPFDKRAAEIKQRLTACQMADHAIGPPALIAEFGPDFCGRYEWVFARLRELLANLQPEITELLSVLDIAEQKELVSDNTKIGSALEAAFHDVMDLSKLVAIFGADATANRRHPFAQHFLRQTRAAFANFPAATNPFLHQILLGKFIGPLWPWLTLDRGTELCPVKYSLGSMQDVIQSASKQSYDIVQLSNILDWIKPEEAEQLLHHAWHCLSPGGIVVIRQLNSTLNIPGVPSRFQWQQDLAAELHQADRSFFYRQIHVGVRS